MGPRAFGTAVAVAGAVGLDVLDVGAGVLVMGSAIGLGRGRDGQILPESRSAATLPRRGAKNTNARRGGRAKRWSGVGSYWMLVQL